MKRLSILVVGFGLLGAACGAGRASSLGPAPSGPSPAPSPSHTVTPPPPSSSSPTPTPTPSRHQSFTYQQWFEVGGKLFVTRRTSEFNSAVGRTALASLIAGPSSIEARAGVTTAISSGTGLLGLTISGGVATVNLTPDFFASGPTGALRRAQVVYTITQYSTVQSVAFQSAGTAVALNGPQTRAGYDGFLPAIVVESPTISQRVSSPVTVSGTADVFEAVVSLRILDQAGNQIAATFTNATCGTGCRGTFSVAMAFHVDREQSGVIEVYESSAKDGSPVNLVRIPVILVP